MQLSDVFMALGERGFEDLLKRVSISRLRTYQMYEQIKVRLRLTKLNSEGLRKAGPRLWERLSGGDAELAMDLSQAILVSHLEMIIAALDFLGVPHQDGFFGKDEDLTAYLTEGWQQRAYDALKEKYPAIVVEFYLNHLGVETGTAETLFVAGQ